ncbi:ATP-dependent Clp protease adaptor ClpS [Amycolatopsis viridis]|uniref:ATP-dependent Clp protease adaptor protein ClpS n=1 Tax=Amycolatopsis viridis TaxID=185678 RepID=A0ABX0T132_9PSEU|nr:ATP-dependent Clp protease adaptor ClpS [Amycolatopsis viridis]NIH82953.1 ATP-dependent Clp protease adaptor protein ClpS [Amycolatopsis viridis]
MSDQQWAVVLHDDDVNSHTTVAFAVARAYGLPVERGFEMAHDVDTAGEGCLTWCTTREQAEALVADLQLWGLHVTLRSR